MRIGLVGIDNQMLAVNAHHPSLVRNTRHEIPFHVGVMGIELSLVCFLPNDKAMSLHPMTNEVTWSQHQWIFNAQQ